MKKLLTAIVLIVFAFTVQKAYGAAVSETLSKSKDQSTVQPAKTKFFNPLSWIAEKKIGWGVQKIAGATLVVSSIDHIVTRTRNPAIAATLCMGYPTALASGLK